MGCPTLYIIYQTASSTLAGLFSLQQTCCSLHWQTTQEVSYIAVFRKAHIPHDSVLVLHYSYISKYLSEYYYLYFTATHSTSDQEFSRYSADTADLDRHIIIIINYSSDIFLTAAAYNNNNNHSAPQYISIFDCA